jgi:hypothetical protein
MHRFSSDLVKKARPGSVVSLMRGMGGARIAGLTALSLLAMAAPAGATITAAATPLAAVQAASSASFSPQSVFNLAGAQGSTIRIGIADSKTVRPPFPRDGGSFLVLSTGDATLADQPDQSGVYPNIDDGGGQIRDRGAGALDVTALQIIYPNPSNAAGAHVAACLDFDLRFLSEEYPDRLSSPYNDAFIAEIDGSSWTTPTTLAPGITAPDAFTFGPNNPVTIKSAAMSPSEAVGTPYGAATAPLRGQVFVPLDTVATTRQFYLSIFDNGDRLYDSAAFVDNIRLTLSATQASCPNGVTSLAPAVAITAPSVSSTVDTQTPTLQGTASPTGAVTVRIYNGALPTGAPVQTVPATLNGTTWSATLTQPLAPGQYTAQATQSNNGINGVSAPATFTVAQPRAAPQGGASGLGPTQAVGDRDNDGIPDDQDTSDGSLPPIPGKTFDARVVSGNVFIKYAPGKGPRAVTPLKGFVPLNGAANVPMGSQLDTRKGRVAVTSAADTGAVKTQTSDFYDGIFEVKQATPKNKPKKPAVLITDLVLKGEPSRSECAPLKGAAAVAATKKKKRGAKSVLGKLWGNGKGKFRTTGKYSSATVRGTIWLTQDRCDGTLTTVKRGVVSVRDFKRKKTVSVKAGHSYLARAQRATGKVARRT